MTAYSGLIYICMSHKTVIRIVDKLGLDHDAQVKVWQNELSKT